MNPNTSKKFLSRRLPKALAKLNSTQFSPPLEITLGLSCFLQRQHANAWQHPRQSSVHHRETLHCSTNLYGPPAFLILVGKLIFAQAIRQSASGCKSFKSVLQKHAIVFCLLVSIETVDSINVSNSSNLGNFLSTLALKISHQGFLRSNQTAKNWVGWFLQFFECERLRKWSLVCTIFWTVELLLLFKFCLVAPSLAPWPVCWRVALSLKTPLTMHLWEPVRNQSSKPIHSRKYHVNKLLQFNYLARSPFVLKIFVDNVFGRLNSAPCKCRFGWTVCFVNVDAFAFSELFGSCFELGSWIGSYFEWFSSDDHATKTFTTFLRTLGSHWLNSEFSWQYISSHKKLFNTLLQISWFVNKN